MIKNLPNFISIYRLVTIPFVAWFLLEELYYYAALFTLLIALSDFLDGFIARYFKVQSELGSYLDAIADKAFVISIFILIGNLKLLPVFIIIIMISRDIIILGSFVVTFLAGKKIEVNPTKISKLNTFFQFCLVITTMLSNINGYEKYFTALMLNEVLITVVLLCTLLSLINYDAQGEVGQDGVGAGTLKRQQAFHHHPILVKPAMAGSRRDHRVFPRHLIGDKAIKISCKIN